MTDGPTRVFVAGHNGMVGSAICRRLADEAGVELVARSREELDLVHLDQVVELLRDERIDQVYLAAARVGGIYANDHYPAEFIQENLAVQDSVIHACHVAGIKRLVFLGSSCIYPREAPQPMKEDALLSGPLEPTNEAYAIAKIAGIKMCESYRRQFGSDFRSIMPTNLYGPNDHFDLQNSHVLPALMRKAHEAKISDAANIEIWGSGKACREFMYVDDLADACVHLMNVGEDRFWGAIPVRCSHVNAGTGVDCSIRELAEQICDVVGFEGELLFDTSRPDGTPRKLLDISRMNSLGWSPKTRLREGLEATYRWMQAHWSDIATG